MYLTGLWKEYELSCLHYSMPRSHFQLPDLTSFSMSLIKTHCWCRSKGSAIDVFLILWCSYKLSMSVLFFFFSPTFCPPQVSGQRANHHRNQCVLSTGWPWKAGAKAVQAAVLQVASASGWSSTERWEVRNISTYFKNELFWYAAF